MKTLIATAIILAGIAIGGLVIIVLLEVNRMLKERHRWK